MVERKTRCCRRCFNIPHSSEVDQRAAGSFPFKKLRRQMVANLLLSFLSYPAPPSRLRPHAVMDTSKKRPAIPAMLACRPFVASAGAVPRARGLRLVRVRVCGNVHQIRLLPLVPPVAAVAAECDFLDETELPQFSFM